MKDHAVSDHYAVADLEQRLLRAAVAAGKDPERLQPDDLAGADEFHLGGRPATQAFADRLPLAPGRRLLDVGSGIGGPSRYFASQRGCQVTGIDLTPEYVEVAEGLARRMGLADRLAYHRGSALALPFGAGSFDGAYMMHVGMNIADKAALFGEVRRVLEPGGFFAIYDVMRVGDGEPAWPLPWASGPATSFVAAPDDYVRLLGEAGFEPGAPVSRRDAALAGLQAMAERTAMAGGPPPLGLQIVMGEAAPQKAANIRQALEAGTFAPVEIIATARS